MNHVMWGRPGCLFQSAGGESIRILLASALSSMRIICPNTVSRRNWIIAVSLGCFVSLRTSSFRTNWYHLMPSSIRRHHWSSASILHIWIYTVFLYEHSRQVTTHQYTLVPELSRVNWEGCDRHKILGVTVYLVTCSVSFL